MKFAFFFTQKKKTLTRLVDSFLEGVQKSFFFVWAKTWRLPKIALELSTELRTKRFSTKTTRSPDSGWKNKKWTSHAAQGAQKKTSATLGENTISHFFNTSGARTKVLLIILTYVTGPCVPVVVVNKNVAIWSGWRCWQRCCEMKMLTARCMRVKNFIFL